MELLQCLGPGHSCTCYNGNASVLDADMCRSPGEPGSESLRLTTVFGPEGAAADALEWWVKVLTLALRGQGAEQQQLSLRDARSKP